MSRHFAGNDWRAFSLSNSSSPFSKQPYTALETLLYAKESVTNVRTSLSFGHGAGRSLGVNYGSDEEQTRQGREITTEFHAAKFTLARAGHTPNPSR